MSRLGMAIDLVRCAGCQTCTVACKVENMIPPGIFWGKVKDYEIGEYPDVRRRFLPILCMHCKVAPCKEVCPTGATIQRADGIVYIDQDKCIGCGYCVVACPYDARTVYKKEVSYYGTPTVYEELSFDLRNPTQRHQIGVASKCTFCMEKIDGSVGKGLRVGVDHEATPTCVNSCIAKARYFGDLDDPDSEVSRLITERRSLRLLEELGTEPSVCYLV